jgi:hypothetical protein
MLNAVILNVIMLSAVMPSVVESKPLSKKVSYNEKSFMKLIQGGFRLDRTEKLRRQRRLPFRQRPRQHRLVLGRRLLLREGRIPGGAVHPRREQFHR